MPNAAIHFITGGQRSGKSRYAEKVTLQQSENPIYLATSKKWDDEHAKRIAIHQQRRSAAWETIEEELHLSRHDLSRRVVLLDCLTLWLTNIFTVHDFHKEASWEQAQSEWEQLIAQDTTLIVVSNEIGMGVIPMEKGTRAFVDIQGQMNQRVAQDAGQVTMMVSGIPWQIKG